MFSPSQVRWGSSQIEIPMTRDTYQSWSDLKKDIRQKVNSKVKGFENQSFIKKSDLLYNFKEENTFLKKGSPLARTSSTYIKSTIEAKFPRESPIKQGLTRSIYSPPKQYPFETAASKKPPIFFSKKSESFASQYKKSEKANNSFDFLRRNKDLNERVTLGEIIRISTHLQDIQLADIPSISSGYLQELVCLQNNINRILKNSTTKIYR